MKRQNLIHILIGIICIGLLPGAQAVVPPPDGGYPGGNAAEGQDALLSLTTDGINMAVVPSNIDVSGQNRVPSASPFAVEAATHETRADLQAALQFPNASEIAAEIETVSSAPSTRSSFMASWERVTGAIGYLLDVSANPSFSDYLEGYHDLDVGNVTGRVVTGLNPGSTYYCRVRAYAATGLGGYSQAMRATTMPTTGLIIHATFDSSITGNANAAAIEAMINRAISIYESLFSDPIAIEILFRYAVTGPDGTPLTQGTLAQSDSVVYGIPWYTFISYLRADAKTSNDSFAIASLPGSALSATIKPKGPNGRAVGLDTPPAMFAWGAVGPSDGYHPQYDGIVTLNSAVPLQFTRPTSANNFDAQRSTEHEIDEVMGLGSHADSSNLRVQDLFSWSSAGVRDITTGGTRYFSINGGLTNIVSFNQSPSLDFGDWLSTACPQANPYVQNASGCTGQSFDIAATSPEGINLDVIGYDLVSAARATVADFNNDGHPDYVLRNASTHQTAVWYLNNNAYVGSAYGPTLAVGWALEGVADFNRDSHADYALFNPVTDQTALWYMSGPVRIANAYGPTLPAGWELTATGDFNGNGYPDYVLFNATTHQTAIWYLNNNAYVGGGFGPTLPIGWSLVGVADFDRDGHRDYVLFNSNTRQSAIWYLSGPTWLRGAYGPTIPSGWALVATADFNSDGHPDYLLYNFASRQTAIWYLNNNVYAGSAYGPSLPAGWSLVAP